MKTITQAKVDKMREAQWAWINSGGTKVTKADFSHCILAGVDLTNFPFRGADFTGADFTDVILKSGYIASAKLDNITGLPQIDPKELIQLLINHTNSGRYNQCCWFGPSHCLGGAVSLAFNNCNHNMACLIIKQALPEFNLQVLYTCTKEAALKELHRVAMIYGVRFTS